MEPVSTPQRHLSPARLAHAASLARKRGALAVLVVVLLALALVALGQGSVELTPGQVLGGLFGTADAQTCLIVRSLRLPHILCAVIAGVALAVSGCVFQSTLHNPLASASTLGITQGAAFGASLAIAVLGAGAGAVAGAAAGAGVGAGATLGAAASAASAASTAAEYLAWDSPALTVALAFAGASISMLAILALSRFRDIQPETIVLAGVALGALFSGATAIVQYFADDTKVAAIVFWTFGSLRRCTYPTLALMAAITALCSTFFALNAWNYNALETGETLAHSLGVRVKTVRLAGLALATLCASVVIAFCGTINFIGLVAPHIMRRIVGADYRYLIPASALCGAVLLLGSDLISTSVVAGTVLPIGAITAFVGVPVFIWILAKGMHR